MSDNPKAGIYETEICNTLDEMNCGYPACNEGGVVVVGYDDYNQDLTGDVTMSLTGARMDSHHVPCAVIYDARGNGDGWVAPTITGDHQDRITDYTAIVVQTNDDNDRKEIL